MDNQVKDYCTVTQYQLFRAVSRPDLEGEVRARSPEDAPADFALAVLRSGDRE